CLSLPLQCIIFVEEEQSTSFFNKSRKIIIHLSETLKGKNLGPVAYSPNNFIKLSFKDDSTNIIKLLNDTVATKVWVLSTIPSLPNPLQNVQPNNNITPPNPVKLRTGIVGIERGIQEKQKATDDNISAAFKDLNRLMMMANDMVHISKAISTKIRERQGDITEDETVKFKSYLLSLGIDDPVTRNSFNNQNEFYQSLAKQISDMMEQPIGEVGGIMSLTDVYCRVNKARGLELLSPEDLLAACQLLNHLKLPIRIRQFDSGVKVLQIEAHTDKAIVTSTAELVWFTFLFFLVSFLKLFATVIRGLNIFLFLLSCTK
ncbi:vacuolar protein-sorting-associated protein 36-like, partial [Lycorma delicatula]|uniref:vacuolar protein-sorting-associated protein 36-like n=1 Tax=Lycorma delicatula TaxID=130591 RepID=UPI003F5183FE